MSAIKFIKEHGVEKAREVVDGAPDLWTTYTTAGVLGGYIRCSGSAGQDEVSISELKRLVESVDIINQIGGIINAKHDVKYLDLDWDYDTPRVTRLKQAIADYEEIYKCTYCNGFGEVGCQFEGTFTCPDCNGHRYVGGEHV